MEPAETLTIKTATWLPLAAALLSTAAGAAQVRELKPAEVAAFVARHDHAIVQVTSPDRNCGYCIGADKKFDTIAAAPASGKFAFARVQHSPWRAMPDWGQLMSVWGVPGHAVFRNGKQVGQVELSRDRDFVASFYDKVDTVLAGPPKEQARAAPQPAPAPAPMSAAETADLRLMVRRDLLRAAMDECGKRFPAGADTYRAAVKSWEAGRKEALNRGAMLFLRGSGDPGQFAGEEIEGLKQWMGSLGIGMQKKQEAADCDRMAASVAQLR